MGAASKRRRRHFMKNITRTQTVDLNAMIEDEVNGILAEIEGFIAAKRNQPKRWPPIHAAINVPERLARSRSIALVWTVEDVRKVRPDLTENQAWGVLEHAQRTYDPDQGLTTGRLRDHALGLFGPAPTPSPALKAALECVTLGPDRDVVFPYQCFLRDGRCVLIRRDGSDHVVIHSTPSRDDAPHVLPPERIPATVYAILETLIAT
jgi:hypothetical protein